MSMKNTKTTVKKGNKLNEDILKIKELILTIFYIYSIPSILGVPLYFYFFNYERILDLGIVWIVGAAAWIIISIFLYIVHKIETRYIVGSYRANYIIGKLLLPSKDYNYDGIDHDVIKKGYNACKERADNYFGIKKKNGKTTD